MATEEELFAQIQTYQPPQIPAEKAAEFAAARQAVEQAQSRVNSLDALATALSFGAQGLSFGLADEALAALSGLAGGPSYSESLAQQQAMREQLRAAAPATALASEVGGGLAQAALTLPFAGTTALGRALFGATKGAPTVAQLATTGAIQGGLYGAGSAAPGERTVGGIMGAGLGGVATPVIGKTLQAGGRLASSLLGRRAAPGLTPAERQVAGILAEAPEERLAEATARLAQAEKLGAPLFLPEAVQSPSLFQQAKLIRNAPASIDIAEQAIEERAANAIGRMTETLDLVNPERNVTAGANKLVEGAKNILSDLAAGRKEITKPIYEEAFETLPRLVSNESKELISSNPRIRKSIKAVRKDLPELADVPDTDIQLLHQVQQDLYKRAKGKKNTYTAGKIKDARKALQEAMFKESPSYEAATKRFAELSKGLTEKEQSKLSFLASVNRNQPGTIGQVFALDPDVIASLRDDFVKTGRIAEWEAGVRSYLQRALNRAQDERNPISKIIGSPELKAKLNAALGDKYDEIIEPLQIEQQILKGQRKYFAGSPTQPLQATQQAVNEAAAAATTGAGLLTNPLGTMGRLIGRALRAKQPDEFYQDYARLLFGGPEQATQTIERLTPFVQALRGGVTAGGLAERAAAGVVPELPSMALGALTQANEQARREAGQLGLVSATEQAEVSGLDENALFDEILNYQMPTSGVSTQSLIEQQTPLVKAIVMTESGGDPMATSKAGAQGLMQLMPATAKELGVTDPMDPQQNIEAGSRYINTLLTRYDGNKMKALAAYNWGMGNLDKAMRKANVNSWPALVRKLGVRSKSNPGGIPKETVEYVKKVMATEKQFMVEA